MQPLAHFLTLFLAILPATGPATPPDSAPASHADEDPILAAREVQLSRIQRSPGQLISRTQAVLSLFSEQTPDEDRLQRWAEASLAAPQRTLQVHPLPEALPGLVVMYHPWEDDLMVMDIERLQARPELDHGPAPTPVDVGVGDIAARQVMTEVLGSLAAAGVLAAGYDPAAARLGLWRELEGRGPDLRAEWIVEYQYTMNRRLAGLELIDAGVRVGIDREGVLSSVRLTDVDVQTQGDVELPLTISQARDAFLAAEQARFPEAVILIDRERVGALLGPEQDELTSPPCLVINYSLRFEDDSGPAAISRQKIATVSLVSGDYAQVYPVPEVAK